MSEKCLGTFPKIYYSPDRKNWVKVELIVSDKHLWVKAETGWKKFPFEDVKVDVKGMSDKMTSMLGYKYGDDVVYFVGSHSRIEKVVECLKPLIGAVETPEETLDKKRSLVARAILDGRTTLADIAFNTKLDPMDVQKINEDFMNEGLISPWGAVKDEGRRKLIKMAGKETLPAR